MKAKYGRIIIYKVKRKLSPGIKSRLSQKLLGHKDKSNYGKYTYKREGLLNNIFHIRSLLEGRAEGEVRYYDYPGARRGSGLSSMQGGDLCPGLMADTIWKLWTPKAVGLLPQLISCAS